MPRRGFWFINFIISSMLLSMNPSVICLVYPDTPTGKIIVLYKAVNSHSPTLWPDGGHIPT